MELVEGVLQEFDQPLSQLGLHTPYFSFVHSPPHCPPKMMAHLNANQPNPPPSWMARSPLNLAPTLHDLPQAFEKMFSSLTQVK